MPRGLGKVKDDARGLVRKPLQAGDQIKAYSKSKKYVCDNI
jgi:hypothetical protein